MESSTWISSPPRPSCRHPPIPKKTRSGPAENEKAGHARLFHWNESALFTAEDDPTLGEVVGREFDRDPVAGQDADVVLAHAAGDVGEYHMAVVQFDAEGGVGKGLHHLAFHLDAFFFSHKPAAVY